MKEGDVIVRTYDYPDAGMVKGDMDEVIMVIGDGASLKKYKNRNHTQIDGRDHAQSSLRLATEREIEAYEQGITNINNIPSDFQTNIHTLIFN